MYSYRQNYWNPPLVSVINRYCATEIINRLTMTVGGEGLDHSLSRYTQGDLKSCISSLVWGQDQHTTQERQMWSDGHWNVLSVGEIATRHWKLSRLSLIQCSISEYECISQKQNLAFLNCKLRLWPDWSTRGLRWGPSFKYFSRC